MDESLHEYFKRIGKKGGSSGKGASKARPSDTARRAALVRWKSKKANNRTKKSRVLVVRDKGET